MDGSCPVPIDYDGNLVEPAIIYVFAFLFKIKKKNRVKPFGFLNNVRPHLESPMSVFPLAAVAVCHHAAPPPLTVADPCWLSEFCHLLWIEFDVCAKERKTKLYRLFYFYSIRSARAFTYTLSLVGAVSFGPPIIFIAFSSV